MSKHAEAAVNRRGRCGSVTAKADHGSSLPRPTRADALDCPRRTAGPATTSRSSERLLRSSIVCEGDRTLEPTSGSTAGQFVRRSRHTLNPSSALR